MMSEHQFALLDRLSMIEHLLEQLAEFYSKHDLMKVVSLAGKIIQDAKMFEQLVDHRHLSQTPDVGVPPSDRIFFSSISDKSAAIAYEVLDE
nr:hypothetical protein [Tanacetum cinerariifolium]